MCFLSDMLYEIKGVQQVLSIMVVFQVLFLLYFVKSYRRRFNFFSNCLNHGFQTFATITASVMFMGTTSSKPRGFEDHLKKNTYNGLGKDYHLPDSTSHTLSSGIAWHPSVLFELLHTTFQLPRPLPIPLLSCALLGTLPLRLQQCCLALEGIAFERPLLLVSVGFLRGSESSSQQRLRYCSIILDRPTILMTFGMTR